MKLFVIISSVTCIFLSGCAQQNKANTNQANSYWSADKVAMSSSRYIALKTSANTVHYNIEVARVRSLLGIHKNIEKSAGDMSVQLHITTGEKANAFAFYYKNQPVVAINLALLDLLGDDPDELAAVLGHEIAHIYEGHGKLRRKRKEDLTVAANIAAIALGFAGVPGGGHLSSITANAISSTYSRDEERDADRIGMNYLWKAGYNPWGAVRVQEKLEKASQATWLPLMNSHPPGAERTQNMREQAKKLTASPP